MKIYLACVNGYKAFYGTDIYCLGCFTKEEDASKAIEASGCYGWVTEIELDKLYEMQEDGWGNMENKNYLGGHVE